MKRTRVFFMALALVVSLSAVAAHAEVLSHPAGVYDRGIELIEAQDYAGALAHFDAAIAESGDVAEFHFYRGFALSQLFRNEEAERAYAKAVELEPENARYLIEYGMTMAFFAGKHQDGYEAVDKAVALEPLNGEYVGDRGIVLFLLNRYDEALVDLKRAIELDPDYGNAYYFAAIIQYELGALEEAVRYCEEYLARVPMANEIRLMLGDAQFGLGRFTEALAAYDQAIASGRFTAEDIVNYAAAEAQAEKPPALQTYYLDDETIPSIDSIVGYRVIPNTEAGFSISQGGPFVKVHYQSDSVLADLQAYTNALIDSGWAATVLSGDNSGGTIQLAIESIQDGKLLMITGEYTADTYSILAQRTGGSLRRYIDDAGNKMGEVLLAGASDTPVTPVEPDERAEAEALIMTPVRADAALADFDGTWYAFYGDYQGAQIPIEIFGIEASLIIENGTVNATIDGETIRLTGDVLAGVLTAAGTDEDGDSVTVSLNLHEDGIMRCALDESLALFFRRTGE